MARALQINQKRDFYEALSEIIGKQICNQAEDDEEKLLYAVLEQFKIRLDKKLVEYRPSYKMSFDFVDAQALRVLYINYINDTKTLMGIKLLNIANQVHQTFTL